MYIGYWQSDVMYNVGDIILTYNLEYFICNKSHTSNTVSYPTKEDMYWIYICSSFLNNLINNSRNFDKTYFSNKSNIDNVVRDNVVKNEKKDQTKLKQILSKKRVYEDSCDFILKISKKPKLKISLDDIEVKDTFAKNTFAKNKIAKNKIADESNLHNSEQYSKLKRKLEFIENDIREYKRAKTIDDVSELKDKLLLMNVDISTKSFVMDKYNSVMKMSSSDHSKGINWLNTISKIPFGKYKDFNISINDSSEKIKEFFKNVKQKLDKSIHGLEDVKQEILEFIARKITNPESKGHVLALYGNAGVGKTKLIKSLAEALDLPFNQINFGGLNDAAILTGHSETYIGSKPGKIVEILNNSQYMNPIIYFDEIDKISESKATEIFGVLTHLLDEEQNEKFQDNYLSNINIDLSKALFVLAFNDISKIDKIVSDRLKVIYINPPNLNDKLLICQDKMIPEILKSINLKNDINIIIDKEVIEYIIHKKTTQESGVRQLRKNIEKLVYRLNYDILIENDILKKECDNTFNITRDYVDKVLKQESQNNDYMDMYI